MLDIVIFIEKTDDDAGVGQYRLSCFAKANGFSTAGYTVDISYGMLATQINNAIRQGAVDTYAASGVTVLPSDKQIIIGGATLN